LNNILLPSADPISDLNLLELDAAWSRASIDVPLATSDITFLRPYARRTVEGGYNWESSGLLSIDLGLPGLGGDESIAGEQPALMKPLGEYYWPAKPRQPSTGQRLARMLRKPPVQREWADFIEGTQNLWAYLVHERSHGQFYEACVLIPDFWDRMHATLAKATGVASAAKPHRTSLTKQDWKVFQQAEREHQGVRERVAGEFGGYATKLSLYTGDWNELWPSMETLAVCAPEKAGEITHAMQPLREEVAAIPADRQRLYLYGRLQSTSMRSEDVELLREHHFDLYVVAEARSGRVDANEAQNLVAEARERGVELDTAYLRSSTPMREHMPLVPGGHPPSARSALATPSSGVTRDLMRNAASLVEPANDANTQVARGPAEISPNLSGGMGAAD
jgi:hypothetical protein